MFFYQRVHPNGVKGALQSFSCQESQAINTTQKQHSWRWVNVCIFVEIQQVMQNSEPLNYTVIKCILDHSEEENTAHKKCLLCNHLHAISISFQVCSFISSISFVHIFNFICSIPFHFMSARKPQPCPKILQITLWKINLIFSRSSPPLFSCKPVTCLLWLGPT